MLTRGAQVTGVASAALALTWISTAARVYVRLHLQKFFGVEDYLTVVAVALLTILCALLLRVVDYGLGAHLETIQMLEPQWLPIGAKYILACELIYTVTLAITKAAIGIYFLRLAGRQYQRIIIHIVMVVVMAYSAVYFLFLLLQCRPVNFLWTQFYGDNGSCVSHTTLADVTYAHAAVSAVTDWALGLLPVTFVWGLKMNPRTKISVVFILSLGFFASTATFVRIAYIRTLTQTDDYTWEGINLAKWSLVEPAIGITAASIATLRPLFKNFLFMNGNSKKKDRNDSHDSEDSETVLRSNLGSSSNNNKKNKQAYSAEFAKMMGLPDYGVTTTITGGVKDENNRFWSRRNRRSDLLPRTRNDGYEMDYKWNNTSSTGITKLGGQDDGRLSTSPAPVNNPWGGIMKTTVVVTNT